MIHVSFTFKGKKYETTRNEYDRNYEDEGYALIFIEGKNGQLFEVNVLKNDNGELIEDGYVSVYEDMDDIMPTEYVENIEVSFK